MLENETSLIYPILLYDIPAVICGLLRDYGLPVEAIDKHGRGEDKETVQPHRHRVVIYDKSAESIDLVKSCELRIQWQELVNDPSTIELINFEAGMPSVWSWLEDGIRLEENLIYENISNDLINRLNNKLLLAGLPWVRVALWPAGYSGVFNFRVDIDEPEVKDWRRVFDGLKDHYDAVTWFLSTRATEQNPEIYEWLEGMDVQSHGHWHHVHSNDSGLNRLNLQKADENLRARGFSVDGFAAPCGRIYMDLAESLKRMNYRYLAGIGAMSGSLPRKLQDGLWRINALPVSEGLYLDAGIDDEEIITRGYYNIADRAIHHDLPVFWYGHAERRLGRKPRIIKNLLSFIDDRGSLWKVQLSAYLRWLELRKKMKLEVEWSRTGEFKVRTANVPQANAPAIFLENKTQRWVIGSEEAQVSLNVNINNSRHIKLSKNFYIDVSKKKEEISGIKVVVKRFLDWERETPVEFLQSGPLRRRIKGMLRSFTDESWRRRFQPLQWSESIEMEDQLA